MVVGVRRWVAGVGVAGGAAVAAALVGTTIARADTIDLFLSQAEDDMSQVTTLLSSLPTQGAGGGFDSLEALTSQIQTQQDGFSEALQSSTQLVSADQQLATASGDLLAASQAFANAINAGDLPLSTMESLTDKLTGLEAGFGFLNAALFQVLPAELNAGFVTLEDGGPLAFTGIAPDTAVGAAPAGSTDPATLLSEGTADLTQAGTILSGIDASGQPSDVASLIPTSTEIVSSQEQIMAGVANLQDVIVDAQAQGASMPGYDLVTEATNVLFTNADQSLLSADAALLSSDQLLAEAISSGAGLTDSDMLQSAVAMLGAVGADFSAFGTTFDAAFTPFLELFSAF